MTRFRILVLALGVFLLFSLLIAHYFKLQILEREKWTKMALAQHECLIKEPCKRGTFYSNPVKRGHPELPQPLVFDVIKFHLYIDPSSIPEKARAEIANYLAKTVALPFAKVRKEFEIKSRSRRLAMWISHEKKESILHWWHAYAKKQKIAPNALYFITDYQRCYPFGTLLGQVLHTIREMKEESTEEGVPTGGLEAYFNAELKGKMGRRKLQRSPRNQLDSEERIEVPEDGADIYLTINHCIQAIVEEELERGVRACRAKGGWAAMMDPFTGEILALAQFPRFDPINYRAYFNDSEKTEAAKTKAVTDAFELGSIMKPITVAIGLKANEELKKQGKKPLFDPKAPLNTMRTLFPGRAHKPLKDIPSHRALNMYMAIQKSSNIYMAEIIDRVIALLGPEWYRRQLVETFGFGEKTGIELPAEAVGLVPTPGKCHPNGALEWSVPTPYSLAIGYNILATSLQMLRGYAPLVNGGYLPKLTLVKKIVKDGEILFDLDKSRPIFPKVLNAEIAEEVKRAMEFTTKPGGTGVLGAINGYTEAGKTGTAEKNVQGSYSKSSHFSSFIGLAPAHSNAQVASPATHQSEVKQLLLIVTMDDPAHILLENGAKNYGGGRAAGPVFKEIMTRTLEYIGIAPDDPYGYPTADPRYDPEKAHGIRAVKELDHLYKAWNK